MSVLKSEPNPAPGFRERPGHTIAIEPLGRPVTVTRDGTILARSDRALRLTEDGYEDRIYIPLEDIEFRHLARTATTTYCPFKGEASYWGAGLPGDAGPDLLWAYETPYDEMTQIADHAAFYGDKVTIELG